MLLIIFEILLYILIIVSSFNNINLIIQLKLGKYHNYDLSFILSVIAQINLL